MNQTLIDNFKYFMENRAIEYSQLSKDEFIVFPKNKHDKLDVYYFMKQRFTDDNGPQIRYDFSKMKIESYDDFKQIINDMKKLSNDFHSILKVERNKITVYYPTEKVKEVFAKYVRKLYDRRFYVDQAETKAATLYIALIPKLVNGELNEELYLDYMHKLFKIVENAGGEVSMPSHYEVIVTAPDDETRQSLTVRLRGYEGLIIINDDGTKKSLVINYLVKENKHVQVQGSPHTKD